MGASASAGKLWLSEGPGLLVENNQYCDQSVLTRVRENFQNKQFV